MAHETPDPAILRGRPTIRFVGDTSRQEASIFQWDVLTKWQQNAVLNTHLRLTEIAQVQLQESRPRHGAGRFLPKIDVSRKNNAVLIDGRRGSGKTIVLFTLLRYWIARNPHFSNELARGSEGNSLNTEIKTALENLEAERTSGQNARSAAKPRPVQIVPIGPVDLQYLSPATQIIPLIAGAFHDVVEGLREIRGTAAGQKDPPWTALPGDSASISERWRDFVTSASVWEVNSAQRQSRLDPEEYVVEVSDMETQRAKLQGKFRTFADALHGDFRNTFGAHGPEPLFVLCIDDADMKPAVSVRLLEALRVLYHPRVAFLLTGNSDLFINMLTDSFFAGLRSPLVRLDLAGDQPDEVNDRSFALRLAREVYGKVIPTAHRIDVPRLPSDERHLILRNVVWKVTKESPRSVLQTLAGDQDDNRAPEVDRKDADGDYPLEHYLRYDKYTLNALPEQLRDMWSLRDFVRDYIERTAAEVADEAPVQDSTDPTTLYHHSLPIRVVQKLWLDALEDSLLNRTFLDQLRNVIRFETRPYFRFFVDNTLLNKNTLSVPLVNARRADGSTMSLRKIVGYEMAATYNQSRAVLSELAEGALILATDLAADYKAGDFVAASLSPDEFDNPFVTMGLPSNGAQGIIDVVWPLPDWDAFIDFHIFSDCWEEIVDPYRRRFRQAVPPNEIVTLLAKHFLQLVIRLANERTFAFTKESEPVSLDKKTLHAKTEAQTWEKLAEQLFELAFSTISPRRTEPGSDTQRVSSRDLINDRWARSRAILLAAPESKLPVDEAASLLQAFRSTFEHSDEWSAIDRDVRLARRARLERAFVHSGKERGKTLEQISLAVPTINVNVVLNEINTTIGRGHPWNDFFNPKGPAATRIARSKKS